jgi:hypothetical protein
MADTKITALTAISTVDPAVDVLPIVDVSDTTMAASGTTKKITSNQILGAGGTATLASATITGDLTVDTSTLKVDSANNRVGIGTATPARPLDIVGSFQSTLGWVLTGTPAGLGAATRYIGGASTTDSWYYNAVSGGSHVWAFGESESMRLNSTGLGVGVSPSYNLDVRAAAATANVQSSTGTNAVSIVARNTGGSFTLGKENSVGGGSGVFGQDAYASVLWSTGAYPIALGTNGAQRMLIDATGNVGIGVTPSVSKLHVGITSTATSGLAEANALKIENNNATVNNAAGLFLSQTGDAGCGIAGIATSRTGGSRTSALALYYYNQATSASPIEGARLDASGNLLVGTTGQNGSWNTKLTLSNDSGTTRWAVGPYLGGVTNFLISAGASAGVYLNGTAATSWTSASDERLKDIIEPISNAVAKVGSLRAVIGKFKFDELNTRKPFLIAQDVQSVLPEAVDASNPDKLGVAYTDVIPLLVAAIKELTARVQTLEAR